MNNSGKVLPFPPKGEEKPTQSIIDILEDALSLAKEGKLSALGLVRVVKTEPTAFEEVFRTNATSAHTLYAGVNVLKHRMTELMASD